MGSWMLPAGLRSVGTRTSDKNLPDPVMNFVVVVDGFRENP